MLHPPRRRRAALAGPAQRSQGLRSAPSTNEGHLIAFGNTEEAIIRRTLGLKERSNGSGALDRSTGAGHVPAYAGDYADALSKRHPVRLFVTESTGALSRRARNLLGTLAHAARARGAHDRTSYGRSRASTKSFFRHHLAAISAAIVYQDAILIANAAATLAFRGTYHRRPEGADAH